jgi:hypothetical protein
MFKFSEMIFRLILSVGMCLAILSKFSMYKKSAKNVFLDYGYEDEYLKELKEILGYDYGDEGEYLKDMLVMLTDFS